MTLWLWAWGRFPVLVVEGLQTINETQIVTVYGAEGPLGTGFPDARSSIHGELRLVNEAGETLGPFSIDKIERMMSERLRWRT